MIQLLVLNKLHLILGTGYKMVNSNEICGILKYSLS